LDQSFLNRFSTLAQRWLNAGVPGANPLVPVVQPALTNPNMAECCWSGRGGDVGSAGGGRGVSGEPNRATRDCDACRCHAGFADPAGCHPCVPRAAPDWVLRPAVAVAVTVATLGAGHRCCPGAVALALPFCLLAAASAMAVRRPPACVCNYSLGACLLSPGCFLLLAGSMFVLSWLFSSTRSFSFYFQEVCSFFLCCCTPTPWIHVHFVLSLLLHTYSLDIRLFRSPFAAVLLLLGYTFVSFSLSWCTPTPWILVFFALPLLLYSYSLDTSSYTLNARHSLLAGFFPTSRMSC